MAFGVPGDIPRLGALVEMRCRRRDAPDLVPSRCLEVRSSGRRPDADDRRPHLVNGSMAMHKPWRSKRRYLHIYRYETPTPDPRP